MSTGNEIARLSEMVFEAMNSRDFSAFEQVITGDVSFDFPGIALAVGDRRTLLIMSTLLRKYPRLHFTISEIITGKDRSCVVWTNQGEDSKGTPYSNSGMTLLHFRDGKICFISDYFKDTSFMQSAL